MDFAQHVIAGATGGLGYDVVDGEGVVVEPVQLPKDRTPVGFGPGGTIYMHYVKPPLVAAIERAQIVR